MESTFMMFDRPGAWAGAAASVMLDRYVRLRREQATVLGYREPCNPHARRVDYFRALFN